jgi:ribose 5-phosphate isomerase A
MGEMMNLKQQAAAKALGYVHDGMVLGLGSGSTTAYFVQMLGEKLQSGAIRDIQGVPTSEATVKLAHACGIPLTTLAENSTLDLAVDGADEVDPHFNLIKGLGRALLREKIVEVHARQFIIIVDESKIVPRLGTKGALPVEIVHFETRAHLNWLNTLGCQANLWYEEDGSEVITDNGNNLALCRFENGIQDAYALAALLQARPGIVEHGLFLDMASMVIVAGESGIRMLEKPQ